jgi:cobalamin-dependent methionine synthase I
MFVVIGERINTSRKPILSAVEKRDIQYIQDDVKKQAEAGASYIDVNAGARPEHEMEDMEWLLGIIQEVISLPISLDSPDTKVIEEAWGLLNKPPMINSISLEKNRYENLLSVLNHRECSVIGLCMDDSGMPIDAQDIIDRAGRLLSGLEDVGIKRENIYIDPLIQPISTDVSKGVMVMEAIQGILRQYPGAHVACGLSNISYGLPKRKIINRTFLTMLMASGLDGAIIDPLDEKMMSILRVSQMLLGQDDYCTKYLKSVRSGKIMD